VASDRLAVGPLPQTMS